MSRMTSCTRQRRGTRPATLTLQQLPSWPSESCEPPRVLYGKGRGPHPGMREVPPGGGRRGCASHHDLRTPEINVLLTSGPRRENGVNGVFAVILPGDAGYSIGDFVPLFIEIRYRKETNSGLNC